jgi:hypothetical protein
LRTIETQLRIMSNQLADSRDFKLHPITIQGAYNIPQLSG